MLLEHSLTSSKEGRSTYVRFYLVAKNSGCLFSFGRKNGNPSAQVWFLFFFWTSSNFPQFSQSYLRFQVAKESVIWLWMPSPLGRGWGKKQVWGSLLTSCFFFNFPYTCDFKWFMCIVDPKLVKPKCVWEVAFFSLLAVVSWKIERFKVPSSNPALGINNNCNMYFWELFYFFKSF